MAQKDVNVEEVGKFSYREFCTMMKRYEQTKQKKESNSPSFSPLRYQPMAKFKRINKTVNKGNK